MKRSVPLLAFAFMTAASAFYVHAQDAPEQDPPMAPADEAPADEAPADEAPADEAPADAAPADEPPADAAPADEPPADAAPGGEGEKPAPAEGDAPEEGSKGDSDLKLGKGTATVERETNRALQNKLPLRVKAKGGEQVPIWTQDTVLLGEDSQGVAEFGGSKVTLMDHTTFRVKSVGPETSICEILGIELELDRGTELEASFGSLNLACTSGNVTARNTGSTPQTLHVQWTDSSGNTYQASLDFPPSAPGAEGPQLQVAPNGAISVPAGAPAISLNVQVTPPGGGAPVSVDLPLTAGQSLSEAAGLPAGASLEGLGDAIRDAAGAEGGTGGGDGTTGGGEGEGEGDGGPDGGPDAGGDSGGSSPPTDVVNPLETTTTQTGANTPIQGTTPNSNNPAQGVASSGLP